MCEPASHLVCEICGSAEPYNNINKNRCNVCDQEQERALCNPCFFNNYGDYKKLIHCAGCTYLICPEHFAKRGLRCGNYYFCMNSCYYGFKGRCITSIEKALDKIDMKDLIYLEKKLWEDYVKKE